MPIPLHAYQPGILESGFYESINFIQGHRLVQAVNASATLTANQVATGYVTCTSTTAVTMTLPTGTSLGNFIGAKQGDILEFYIDNTASSSSGVVTLAVGTNAILSAAAAAGSGAGAGLLTIPVGATGIGGFQVMFTSPTAYVISRIA